MLSFNVYRNSLYMMLHRGFDAAEELVSSLGKEPVSDYISGSMYHNIGYRFETHVHAEMKDVEDRFMMSYCLDDEARMKKAYVIFGVNSKSCLEALSDILLDSLERDKGYAVNFSLILNKDFNSKYATRLDEISLRFDLQVHMESSFRKPPFHAYGPKYELMTDEEVSMLIRDIRVTKKQLAKISANLDPIVKYFAYPKGSVLRIKRTPIVPGSLVLNPWYYRVVV